MKTKYILEICTSTYAAALAASRAGADRVELCSGLGEGGLTPSAGMIREVIKLPHVRKNILIRPRGGDFLYSPEEINIMKEDVLTARDCGAHGVVFGALRADGHVDMDAMNTLMEAAEGMEVTFHRAFDMCCNPEQALEDIIKLGCRRILTSGQAPKAAMAIRRLRDLVEQAAGRIVVMPGCGVNEENARKILEETGATEIHASASSIHESKMNYRNPNVCMGNDGTDEFSIYESDERKILNILKALND